MVGELGVDSLSASQILVETEIALQREFNYESLPEDWSDLSLSELSGILLRDDPAH